MNRKCVEEYYHNVFLPVMSEVYTKVKADMEEHGEQIKDTWIGELQNIYEKICEMQEKMQFQKVGLVSVSFLRTRYLEGNYKYAVYAYEEDGFAGKEIRVGELDVSYFFKYHRETLERLQKEAKKYFGKVTSRDVERLMLEEVGRNTLFSYSLFRKWKSSLFEMEAFRNIKKAQTFQIVLGEYFEPVYVMYEQDISVDRRKKRRRLCREKIQYLEKYADINLDGSFLETMDFLDATFEDASMRNSEWINCAAQGTVFRHVILTGARFYQCMLQESIWFESDMRDVVFEECLFYKGESGTRKQFIPDYREVTLEGCNLDGTKFVRCNLAGMDFTKSNIENCIFEDCELTGCIFTGEQIRNKELDVQKWRLHTEEKKIIIETRE